MFTKCASALNNNILDIMNKRVIRYPDVITTGSATTSLDTYIQNLVINCRSLSETIIPYNVPFLFRAIKGGGGAYAVGIGCNFRDNYAHVWVFIDAGTIGYGEYYGGNYAIKKINLS